MPNKESFGERLRSIRCRRDLTAARLADLAETDPSVISHFERGNRIPNMASLRKLAIALDVTADYLLGLSESTSRLSPSQERPY